MQFLLSQQEYNDLVNAKEKAIAEVGDVLQDLCSKVCDHMPVSIKWREKGKPQPWGCILTRGEDKHPDSWYCDECPVQKACPNDRKHYSQ
jgi:hypothetical protein